MNFSFFFKSYSRISRLSESHLLLRYDRQIEYFLNFYIGKGKGKGDIYITYIYRPSSKKIDFKCRSARRAYFTTTF